MSRILILSNLYPPNVIGGYERLCFEVASALAAAGHQITVLTSRYGGKPGTYPNQRIIRELDLLTGPDIYTPFPGTSAEREAINRSNLKTFETTLAREKPDVIFSWNLFFLDSSLLTALEKSRIRTVVMLTDNWLLVMRNPVFVHNFFQNTIFGATPLTPPTALNWKGKLKNLLLNRRPHLDAIFGARYMQTFYAAGGANFRHSKVIHNGVRQNTYLSVPTADRTQLVEPGTLRLLFAGRLVDLKGAHTTIAALAHLTPSGLGVTRIELTLVGDAQDAAYMQTLHNAIAQSGQSANIHLEPSVPESDLPKLFNAHDIYLFPSLYEPFSLTLIHALALGIPTIASDTGGNPEIVKHHENGLLFPKGDAASLAAAITVLAKDPVQRAQLAKSGRAAAAHFTFERMVDEMSNFLVPQA